MDAIRFHQVVPRPRVTAPGEPPSWLSDPGNSGSVHFELGALSASLASTLGPVDIERSVSSAVLVGLTEMKDEAALLLTRRAATLRSEPLTVSFPGGRLEPGETALEAALREAEEEIGLHRSNVRVLGSLAVVDRQIRDERVLPVVAEIDRGFEPRPNPAEVDEVLVVPLAALLEDGVAWSERWGSDEEAREVRFFAHDVVLGSDLIWGLTAKMIWELLELALAGRS